MALTIVFMSVIWLFKCKITYFLSFCKVFFAIFVKHEAKELQQATNFEAKGGIFMVLNCIVFSNFRASEKEDNSGKVVNLSQMSKSTFSVRVDKC